MTDKHRELVCKLADLRKIVDAATLTPWYSLESQATWTLYGEARAFKGKGGSSTQIVKAAKHGTPYDEYWPNSADADMMVVSANRFSFWLDWADDVAARHFPVICGCKEAHFLCAAHRTYSWESCPEVIGLIRAVDVLHR